MRVPPTNETRRRTLGLRVWLIGAVVLLIILLASLRGLARFYTDYLWFHEVGFSATWRGLIGAKVIPTIVFTAFFFVLMLANLVIADRLAPRTRAMGPEDEMVERYRSYVAPYSGRVRFAISAFFAFIVGSGVSSQWSEWILYRNHVSFHQRDPQFHRDIGFYVFQLPFLRFVSQWLFVTFVLVLLVVAVFHYINGGIRLQTPFQRVTPQVKAHLSVILALMAFVKTWQYFLARFELVFSTRGTVDGATFTDVHAQLPALNFLMIISVAAALLFIVNIRLRGWVLPVIAVGLWGFISIVVGTIYPAVIQRTEVKPNELSKEQPYIGRNITATRFAFGINHITSQPYNYKENLTPTILNASANKATLENARLWDPDQLQPNFQQNQKFRPYFAFSDLDLDRYPIGDQKLEVEISVRELNSSQLPSSTWLNQHLVYTHGYGAAATAANAVNPSDQTPDYLLSDIPPTGDPHLTVSQPSVYYGEGLSGFTVVDSKQPENQPTASQNDSTVRYNGTGGVQISSFLRKAAISLSFGSWDLFISHQVDSHSRVMFLRDVTDRVQKAAPFLKLDADPYAAVVDGKLEWIIDAYTTTNRYPYSQSLHPTGLSGRSGLDSTFNYVRNSVKVTVDAYNGTIKFYVIDPTDPIIQAYEKAFPKMFTPASKVPADLRAHFRYPEDIFRAQTEQYQRYHLTGVSEFYRAGNLWSVAPAANANDSTSAPATAAPSGNNGGRNAQLATTGPRIDPLYLMMQLPGTLGQNTGQEFVLERSFVPAANPNVLTAFIVARSDGANYGQLVLYDTPDNQDIPSPSKAATNIDSNTDISKQLSLLDQHGSAVVRGDVQLIPIGDSILYVRPIYVETTEGAVFPRFKYVAVTYGEKSVLSDSIPAALNALFGSGTSTSTPTTGNNTTTPPPTGTVAVLLAKAQTEFNAANTALTQGDLATYAKDIKAAQADVTAAIRALAAVASTTTPTTTPTTGAPGATTTTPVATTTTALPPA